MIADDIGLSQARARAASRHPELELIAQNLSITTFRYVPGDLHAKRHEEHMANHLDALNREVLDRVQRRGETFVSTRWWAAVTCCARASWSFTPIKRTLRPGRRLWRESDER